MEQVTKKLISNPLLNLATAPNKLTKKWHNQEMSWADFLKHLTTPTITQETQEEYFKMSKGQRDDIKDVGGYVGGFLKQGRRKADAVQSRSMITLDADFPKPGLWEDVTMVFDSAVAAYSTHSYTTKNPRIRLIIPLKRLVTPDEYVPLARKVAQMFGMDSFDDTTYQPERLMFWASHSINAPYFFRYEDGPLLDPDEILGQYEDWRDSSFWPVSSREHSVHETQAKKAGDPLTKPGVVGAFNRTYDIKSVIDTFLPDTYEPTSHDDRYTYTAGTTSAGLVLYDDKFAYSHHGTDPTGDMLTNAFDLVRLHKFGGLDDKAKDGASVTTLPSYKAMMDFALEDKRVKAEWAKEKIGEAQEEFSDDPEEQEDLEDWLSVNALGNPVINPYLLAQHINRDLPTYYNGKEFIRYDKDTGIWRTDAEDYLKGLITNKYLRKLAKISPVRETVASVQNIIVTSKEFPTSDLNKLILSNGVYDLATDSFVPEFDPDLHGRISHPIKYDTKARADTFDSYIEWLVGAEHKPFIYEWFGYNFYRAYSIQKMLFLYGSGGTGKSTLFNILKEMIGTQSFSAVTLEALMTKQFAAANLYQKTANFDTDAKPEFLGDGSTLKIMTGEDTVYADVKFEQPLSFSNFAKLNFAMNALPPMRDFSGGLERRALILKVDKKVTNAVKKELPYSQMLKELPGIFNLAMAGLRRALKQNGFTVTGAMNDELAHWLKGNDQVARFIEENCNVGEKYHIAAEDFYLVYQQASDEAGEKPLGKYKFYQRIEELGFKRRKIEVSGQRVTSWIGIQPKINDFD